MAIAAILICTPLAAIKAQTPDEVINTTIAVGGQYAPCLLAIEHREDPPLILHQPNLDGSGAEGLFQIMPATWASTPTGQQVPLAVASAAQQVQAAVELLMSGWSSAWAPKPAACQGL